MAYTTVQMLYSENIDPFSAVLGLSLQASSNLPMTAWVSSLYARFILQFILFVYLDSL